MVRAAIYNVFDGEELLEGSINCIRQDFDKVTAIVQTISNHGNKYMGGFYEVERLFYKGLIDYVEVFAPNLHRSAMQNETDKRNIGIKIARKLRATHFMHLDCDEYWESVPEPDQAHRMYTYFKVPTLRYKEKEPYYVPGLITLRRNTQVGSFNCGFYCDPTRRPNHKLTEGSEIMHHFSYVRKDINRKIENSSAKSNIFAKKKELMQDLEHACNGYEMRFTDNKLISVPNSFNIEIPIYKSIQSG